MSMTTIEILKAARELISDPKRWTQGAYARDADGNEVNPGSPEAVCYCSLGAIRSFGANPYHASEFLNKAVYRMGYVRTWVFNDEKSHPDVLSMFDEALKIAKEQLARDRQ